VVCFIVLVKMKRAFADFCGCSGDQECNSCARPGTSRIRSSPANVSTNDSPLLRSLLHPKRLSKIIIHSDKLIKKPRIETIKNLLHSLGLVYKSMRGMMTNSIDRDQWLNVTSESRDRI
jgi:hypothetical protein